MNRLSLEKSVGILLRFGDNALIGCWDALKMPKFSNLNSTLTKEQRLPTLTQVPIAQLDLKYVKVITLIRNEEKQNKHRTENMGTYRQKKETRKPKWLL